MCAPSLSLSPWNSRKGFSLVELLVVIAIVGILSSIGTAMVSQLGAGSVQQASINAEGVLEDARQFAMSHNTYVRVGFAQISLNGRPSVAVQSIGSTSGDLRADTSSDINDPTQWPMIERPVVLSGTSLNNQLLSGLPAANSSTVEPLGTSFNGFTRSGPNGAPTTYSQILQFDPNGQASVSVNSVSRCIGLGLSNPQQSHNSVVILLSGLTGNVQVLREENLTLQ